MNLSDKPHQLLGPAAYKLQDFTTSLCSLKTNGSPLKMRVGKLLSFQEDPLSGTLAVSFSECTIWTMGRELPKIPKQNQTFRRSWGIRFNLFVFRSTSVPGQERHGNYNEIPRVLNEIHRHSCSIFQLLAMFVHRSTVEMPQENFLKKKCKKNPPSTLLNLFLGWGTLPETDSHRTFK